MSSIKLTKKESRNLRKNLPESAASEIAATLKISKRMVQYVLAGKFGDRHGIIELAAKHKEAERVRKETLLASLA